jgi:dipeptide/tripeptide permease
MWLYGFTGFVIGFLLGMIANAYLLRGVSRERLRTDRDIRLKYGALNWGLAVLGAVLAVAVAENG